MPINDSRFRFFQTATLHGLKIKNFKSVFGVFSYCEVLMSMSEQDSTRKLLKKWVVAIKSLSVALGSWRRIAILDILDTIGPQIAGEIINWFEDVGWHLPKSEAHRHLNILIEAKLVVQMETRGRYEITALGKLILEAYKRVGGQIAGGAKFFEVLEALRREPDMSILDVKEIFHPTSIERGIASKILNEYRCTTSDSVVRLVQTILAVAQEEGTIKSSDIIKLVDKIQKSTRLRPILLR